MIEKLCKWCNKLIIVEKFQQFGGHITNCKMNPKRKDIIDSIKKTRRLSNPILLYKFNCKYCNEEYILELKEKTFLNNDYKKFCSKKCSSNFSRSFIDETKLKDSLCKKCNKPIKVKMYASNKSFCEECREKSIKIEKINSSKSLNPKSIIVNNTICCNLCGQEKCIDEYICSKYRIINSLKRLGFDDNKLGSLYYYEEYNRIRNLMIEEYDLNELSLPQIGIKYDINFQTLFYLFKNIDIKIRTLSESGFIYAKNNIIISPSYNKYKCGWYESLLGNKHFYRSSFELDYYKKLDDDKIIYETETLRIEYFDTVLNKKRISIPDIFIPSENHILEIKSDWTYNELNMNDKIKSYKELGYNVTLLIGHGKKIFDNLEIKKY